MAQSVIDPTMTREERLNKIHGEARGAIARSVRYWCPWGCKKDQCDQYGYCKHLLGFVNLVIMEDDGLGRSPCPVGTEYEPIRTLFRFNAAGLPYDSGSKMVTAFDKQLSEEGDVLVNEGRKQTVNGYESIAKEVTSYVFRKNVVEQAPLPPNPIPLTEEMRLKQAHEEYRKKCEKLDMKTQIAEWKQKLGEVLSDEEVELLAMKNAALQPRGTETLNIPQEAESPKKKK